MHGPPKVGKTQLASKFPGPVQWIATEFGHKFLPEEQRKTLIQIPLSTEGWETFESAPSTIKASKVKPKTIVIDTSSGLYDVAMQYTCTKNGWEHPQDGPHGKGWSEVEKTLFRGLGKFLEFSNKISATLIFIDHTKTETIETATETVEKVVVGMTGQARKIFLKIPDFIWFLGYAAEDIKNLTAGDALKNTESKRALFVGGSNAVEAGTRDPVASAAKRIISPLSKKDPYTQILRELYGEKKDA